MTEFRADDWIGKLKYMKTALGLNNTQTANILGTSRGLVAAWLDNMKRPREPHFSKLDQVVRLLQATGIEVLSPRLVKDTNLHDLLAQKPSMDESFVLAELRALKAEQDALEATLRAKNASLDALVGAQ